MGSRESYKSAPAPSVVDDAIANELDQCISTINRVAPVTKPLPIRNITASAISSSVAPESRLPV